MVPREPELRMKRSSAMLRGSMVSVSSGKRWWRSIRMVRGSDGEEFAPVLMLRIGTDAAKAAGYDSEDC